MIIKLENYMILIILNLMGVNHYKKIFYYNRDICLSLPASFSLTFSSGIKHLPLSYGVCAKITSISAQNVLLRYTLRQFKVVYCLSKTSHPRRAFFV